jgi:hypothetical protein
MANTIEMKQSSVAGKVPTTTDLSLGELAVNTTDGKLFLKKSVSGIETIVDVTATLSSQTLSDLTLQSVSTTLHRSPNAITALFVLDTSKDSEGGAWTEKCQHTSWYNETMYGKWLGAQASESAARAVSGATTDDYYQLTTDGKFYKLNSASGVTEVYRGNKRSFPKMAAIVAESASVTIYDLTEAGRPMFARFVNTGAMATGSITAIHALSGQIYVGGGSGLAQLDFAKDRLVLRNTSGLSSQAALATSRIAARTTTTGAAFIASAVNNIAATVLPDAPVDPVTGLRVPTVAVTTSARVVLIHNNGTLVNSSNTSAFTQVTLTPQFLSAGRADAVWYTAANPGSLSASFALTTKASATATDFNVGNTSLLKAKDRAHYARSSGAVVQLLRNNEGTIGKGLAAKLSNTYNAGWLVGDIRRAYLANSQTADRSYKAATAVVTGTITEAAVATGAGLTAYSGFSASNYIREPYSPDFDFGAGEWTASAWVNVPTANAAAGTIACSEHSSGPYIRLRIDATNKLTATAYDGTTTRTVTTAAAYNTGTWLKARVNYTTDGKLAILVNGVEVASATGTPLLSLAAQYNLLTQTQTFTTWFQYFCSVTPNNATAPDGTVTAGRLNTTGTGQYIRLATSQAVSTTYTFSVYAKAGTSSWLVLVNYPVNNGTNIGAWFNLTTGTTGTIQAGYSSAAITDAGNGWWRCSVTGTSLGTITNNLVDITSATANGSGVGTGNLFLWGAQLEQGASATTYQRVGTIAETIVPVLTIGNSFALDAPFPGSLALLKLSANVPTAEQALFAYEQEQQLFQAGAQCVLPASTNVLDLAYDDATDAWSALQATFESTWSGLVRTATQAPSAGSFSKSSANSGIKLLSRTTTNPGVEVQIPAKNVRPKDMPRDINQDITVFDFDAVTSQTDFVLPVGYTARVVYSAGSQKREGPTKDWTRLYDGFRETIRFAVAPGNTVWVQLHAVREVAP